MSKKKFLSAFPAAPVTESRTVIAAAGIGRPVEVRTVSALVHLQILNSRRALAVASILRRVQAARSVQIPVPRSDCHCRVCRGDHAGYGPCTKEERNVPNAITFKK